MTRCGADASWFLTVLVRPCGLGLASPDVRASDFALHSGHAFCRVDLKLGALETCLDDGGPIGVDRDGSRDASGPLLQRPLDFRRERLELDHVGDRESPTWLEEAKSFLDHGCLVLGEVDHAVRDEDVDRSVWKRDILDRAP